MPTSTAGTTVGGLMVCGTTSDAGKTQVVAGLCRVLHRRGVRVAPFKGQNMALNSAVTSSGHEIGRAQAFQAAAAGVAPEVAMNPVLLKPTSERTSQVVVLGRPVAELSALDYHRFKAQLLDTVLDALADLRRRYDVVLAEGAGSPAEINLAGHDIVNLRLAERAGLPAVVVGDINRGGVFAALYGTVALLPDAQRRLVRGFVINKLRGDPALLLDGCRQLEARCGVPTLGVVPWLDDLALDAEDSMALHGPRPRPAGPALGDTLDVAVVAFPRLANVTDVDPLAIEPGVAVRLVHDAAGLGRPDLVVLPGTKATVADLDWLRSSGLAAAVAATPTTVVGLCGGYQMLGGVIDDPVESRRGRVEGLGLLPVRTRFRADKVTRWRTGRGGGHPVAGYQIHHGRVTPEGGDAWVVLDDGTVEGVAVDRAVGGVLGTTLHGLFEADAFRAAFLAAVAERAGKRWVWAGTCFDAARQAQIDRLADSLEAHLDLGAVERLLAEGAPAPAGAEMRS